MGVGGLAVAHTYHVNHRPGEMRSAGTARAALARLARLARPSPLGQAHTNAVEAASRAAALAPRRWQHGGGGAAAAAGAESVNPWSSAVSDAEMLIGSVALPAHGAAASCATPLHRVQRLPPPYVAAAELRR